MEGRRGEAAGGGHSFPGTFRDGGRVERFPRTVCQRNPENRIKFLNLYSKYKDNVKPFWERLGFCSCERISLDWGNKRSSAQVMKKEITGETQNGKNQNNSGQHM